MKYDYSEIMIDTLNSFINNDINDCDKDDVLFLINMIEKSKTCILSIEELEELEDMKKMEQDLELKYDSLLDFNYYFDPFTVLVKKKIHKNEVRKLRENYRRNRKKLPIIINN